MRMYKKIFALCILNFAVCASAMAVDFPSASNTGVMSKYGQIQNVQNYSSNPFWNPDAPYNQRMPQPIYAQGADLTAAECRSVTSMLVAQQCSMRDNCIGARLSDIRPAIMVQLSNMTDRNYVGSCAGFIDGAFSDYAAQNQNINSHSNFPTAITPGNNINQPTEFKIENPYQRPEPEPWLQDIIDRKNELEQLQSQNGANSEHLVKTAMPTTYADLSFTERMENARAGYEEWAPVYGKDRDGNTICIKNCTYQTLNIESDTTFWTRQAQIAQQKAAIEQLRNPQQAQQGQIDGNTKNHIKIILKSLSKE